ncbi:hypothetical protein [Sphingomonas sp.]|jgi:hypothetical protein|uniref:hypothetical protein n=1 Tax=Sphingomonas sp. TaxID=28214 RepID=UPI002EDA020E
MLSQAAQNLEEARVLRAAGCSYRHIGRTLALTSSQLSHIRRALKREKAGFTRLRSAGSLADGRDLPVRQSALPAGLRARLVEAGLKTLGDVADRVADPDLPPLEAIAGIGPHRALLIRRLLDQLDLALGTRDLQDAVEQIFPELR